MHLREEMSPFIVNLDSAFDWTAEVRQIWERLDWDGIRRATAPQIPSEPWARRGNELALVGLVSSLLIDDSYHLPQWEESHEKAEQREDRREDALSHEWRERQLGRSTSQDETNNDRPRRRPRFNGEEPFFRSPHVGRPGIVECYGIYVDDAATILGPRDLLDKVPAAVHHAPAVFLCPERIHGIYPTVISLGEHLRHPLRLSSNPALFSLQMTLLHELGHHFFPVHRSGAGRFFSEALANLFCHHGLDQDEQAWLLYKSWHLQPPEYSAYRPLRVLCEADSDCRFAAAECFHGGLGGWASLPKKDAYCLERNLGASLTMALAADAAACKGLRGDELRQVVSVENRWFLHWEGNHLHFHLKRRDDDNIPADFVLDLYRQNDLANWTTTEDLPSHIWGRWAYGNEVRWPHDCINVAEADVEGWLAYCASAKDTSLASVIYEKLLPVLHANPGAVTRPGVRAALDRALAVATNDQAKWFDRVPAIRFIEACRDTIAIPALEKAFPASKEWGNDVREAAAKALTLLRASLGSSSIVEDIDGRGTGKKRLAADGALRRR